MPVVMIMEWPGVSKEQYDQVKQLVNWEGEPAPGGLFHTTAFDEQGLRVVDLWESPELMQTFFEQRLMPGVQQAGIQGQPKVEVFPTHDLFTPGFTPRAGARA